MPAAPKRPCSSPGCAQFQPCKIHNFSFRNRDTKSVSERKFYSSMEWRRKREAHRKAEPFCRMHKAEGIYVMGQMVDHIKPMREGGEPLDDANLQTLCNTHHAIKRQQESIVSH